MRKIFIIILLTSIFACNSEKNTKNETHIDSYSSVISEFLSDTKTLENIKDNNPITLFQKLAENEASEVFIVSKDNIKDILSSAKEYSNLVITTGNHTIVKIIDINNCKQSGAWGVCMPFANGYIKKGELIWQEGYINNSIGIPDSQVRKAYFFD